eukprot:GABV01002785.1.p1 GENE.GABV01002785.1~~GABV01002785.1.p1  ORF type:complete len:146 (-),score=43.68 GABV01002785.1:38-475(-)
MTPAAGQQELECAFNGSVALSSQEAWILNRTVKDNIVFDREFDEARYKKVLKICALEPDLATLPAGDATEIGERGVNLSGGQKQRIGVARCVYGEADIFLMDDPLSALDNETGRFLFKTVLQGFLATKLAFSSLTNSNTRNTPIT